MDIGNLAKDSPIPVLEGWILKHGIHRMRLERMKDSGVCMTFEAQPYHIAWLVAGLHKRNAISASLGNVRATICYLHKIDV